MVSRLSDSVRYVQGVGPKKQELFNALGVNTINDLLYYFPFRYEDRSMPVELAGIKDGQICLVKVKVKDSRLKKMPYFRRSRKVRDIFEILVSDDTGIAKVTWFNRGYLAAKVKIGAEIFLYGKAFYKDNALTFNSPDCQLVEEDSPNMERIVGVYGLTGTLTSKFLRKVIDNALKKYKDLLIDSLPHDIRIARGLIGIMQSVTNMHFPLSWDMAYKARQRLIFEELFYSQILVHLRKARHKQQKSVKLDVPDGFIDKIKKNAGFEFTGAQVKVINDIMSDISKGYPMHRLLQGDVGCGKTVVAAVALASCALCGYQSALMVPTEVLAYQHRDSLGDILEGMGFRIDILTASLSKKQTEKIHAKLADGEIDIIIGTHALISEEVRFRKLAMTVIDEQHKFGVAQRALLPKKSDITPHCLVMSATPIPRSLAMSIYGDLDISVIDEMPEGRPVPKSFWMKEDRRGEVYDFLKTRIKEGRQVYFVYPAIDDDPELELKSIKKMGAELKKVFSSERVEVFHGRMKAADKLKVIEDFKNGKIKVLVATTVVEVGVNVLNATVMVVECPDRFGLAQLHQLRGRIRRSDIQPYFILLGDISASDAAYKRIESIVASHDGFQIAESDLLQRGPGDFFGSSQHGFPPLKIADPIKDMELLSDARDCASKIINDDPYLDKYKNKIIKEHLYFWFQR
ncbi:MAG: ATP-dependent DNA helicase RecG [Candidatus Omnitrophica bacterium]|nr:ATP-dependent DNA helicase RecG [Candidatus Omnitrophota bacterium]MDD5441455.1 ATP-dependent DNA helicase RecG [Candidatus Omnitrophota bacterium]